MSYILFGNKNTQTDYGLIVAPYEIPMPTAQTNFVPVPGHDGSLDLTEAFDAILFNDRTHSSIILNKLKLMGISERTIHSAKKEVGVQSYRSDGVWYWHLDTPLDT